VISAVGGAVVLFQGIVVLVYGEALTYAIVWGNGPGSLSLGLGIGAEGLFEIIIGACMLAGAYLMASNYFKVIGAIVVLIFSIASIAVGGGWFFGLILGLVGGMLGLFRG